MQPLIEGNQRLASPGRAVFEGSGSSDGRGRRDLPPGRIRLSGLRRRTRRTSRVTAMFSRSLPPPMLYTSPSTPNSSR